MINIFNFFLFLLTIWVCFMLVNHKISLFYLFVGICFSFMISMLSYRVRIIERSSEFLYLSLGFYRYLTKCFLKNFYSGIKLIIFMALGDFWKKNSKEINSQNSLNPVVISFNKLVEDFINHETKYKALLLFSIMMNTGLMAIDLDDDILIHAVSNEHLKNLNLVQIFRSLENVNDDNLV